MQSEDRMSVRHRPVGDVTFLAMSGALAVILSFILVANATSHLLAIATVALLSTLQWTTLQKSSGQSVPLPGIAIVGLNVVGILGWIYYPTIAHGAAVSAVLPDTPEIYGTASAIFILTSCSIFVGGLIAGGRGTSREVRTIENVQLAFSMAERVISGRLTGLAVLPLAWQIMCYSPRGLLSRPHYGTVVLPEIFVICGTALTPVGISLAALLTFKAGPPQARQRGLYIILAYLFVLFCMGTRQIAMIPMLVLLAWMLRRPAQDSDMLRKALVTSSALASTLLLLQLPISMRGMSSSAGLIPYFDVLTKSPATLFTLDIPRILGNILFSVPLSGASARVHSFDMSWLITSINPLPSAFTNWTDIKGGLRLNLYTPTSGLGELMNYGAPYLITYMIILGFLLARVQRWNSKLTAGKAAISTVVGIGLTGATVLNLMQYNLRTGTRDIWYLLMISAVLQATNRITQNEPTRDRESDHLL